MRQSDPLPTCTPPPVPVRPPTPGKPILPVTGANVGPLAAVASLCLLSGTGAVIAARRIRS